MNGRLFAKRFVGAAALLFGVAALAADGEVWMKALLFTACVALAITLFRRTPRDDEWMRKYRSGELTGQVIAKGVGEIAAERDERPPDPQRKLKGALAGVTALNVLSSPFRLVWDLMKRQK